MMEVLYRQQLTCIFYSIILLDTQPHGWWVIVTCIRLTCLTAPLCYLVTFKVWIFICIYIYIHNYIYKIYISRSYICIYFLNIAPLICLVYLFSNNMWHVVCGLTSAMFKHDNTTGARATILSSIPPINHVVQPLYKRYFYVHNVSLAIYNGASFEDSNERILL